MPGSGQKRALAEDRSRVIAVHGQERSASNARFVAAQVYSTNERTDKVPRLLLVAVLAFLTASTTARATSDSQHFSYSDFPSRQNIDAIGERNANYVRAFVGDERGARVVALLKHESSDPRLLAGCVGSFTKRGESELAIAWLIDGNTKLAFGVVSWAGSLSGRLHVLSLQRVEYSGTGVLRKPPDVMCSSWTQLERTATSYRSMEHGGTDLSPIGKLDAICATPAESGSDFECYQYRSSTGKFDMIGGWLND